jgi:hypothetical protein
MELGDTLEFCGCEEPPSLQELRTEVERWMTALDMGPRYPIDPDHVRLDNMCALLLYLSEGLPLGDVLSADDEEFSDALIAVLTRYLWPIVEAVGDAAERWHTLFESRPYEICPIRHPVERLGFLEALRECMAADLTEDLRQRVEAQYARRERAAKDDLQLDLFEAGEGDLVWEFEGELES